jgi:transcriptional regulator with XRE-family HTH domain
MDKHPIRRFRDGRGLSQDDLARLLGVKSITVSRWERGIRSPRRSLRPKIREVTGIQPSEIAEFESRLQGAAA